jgi:hypothetical protein
MVSTLDCASRAVMLEAGDGNQTRAISWELPMVRELTARRAGRRGLTALDCPFTRDAAVADPEREHDRERGIPARSSGRCR